MLGGKHRLHRQVETSSAGLKTKLMSLTSFFDALNPAGLLKNSKFDGSYVCSFWLSLWPPLVSFISKILTVLLACGSLLRFYDDFTASFDYFFHYFWKQRNRKPLCKKLKRMEGQDDTIWFLWKGKFFWREINTIEKTKASGPLKEKHNQ